MKSKFLVVFLCISVLLGVGLYPLLAQQVNPLGGYSQSGQIPAPYGGIQSYGSSPQAPQGQGYNPQGTTRSPGLQAPPADLSQISQRACGWAAVTQPPSLPPLSTLPTPPQTVPVQGIWGASAGVAGAQLGPQQPQQISPKDARSAQGPPVPVLFTEPLSAIEAAFQQAPISAGESRKELRQYGYSLFSSPVSTFAPVEDVPVGPDYILGTGGDPAGHRRAPTRA